MQKIWIKICGITRAQDALAAATLGADAIGLVLFANSPRSVTVEQMAAIVGNIPRPIKVVALFVEPDPDLVWQALATGLVDLLQFHGAEPVEFCEQFSTRYIKAIAVKEDSVLSQDLASYSSANYLLLDSYHPLLPGGTGKAFDWDKLRQLAENQRSRLVLAGGLNPGNIQAAIHAIQPFGVDVSSGVEASKGIKDLSKMKSFIEGARASG